MWSKYKAHIYGMSVYDLSALTVIDMIGDDEAVLLPRWGLFGCGTDDGLRLLTKSSLHVWCR